MCLYYPVNLVWPNILLTDSTGTPLLNATVAAKVCRARWYVKFVESRKAQRDFLNNCLTSD